MRVDSTFLRSRVARRIFFLFVVCALLPIFLLAILSFRQVTAQLRRHGQSHLRQATKAASIAIHERLIFVEGEMKVIGVDAARGTAVFPPEVSSGSDTTLTSPLKGLIHMAGSDRERTLYGRMPDPPRLSALDREHLGSGKSLVTSTLSPGLEARIFMSRLVDPLNPGRGILTGEINPDYLWDKGPDSSLPPTTELCVLDQENTALSCSLPLPASIRRQLAVAARQSALGQFEWEQGGKDYLASYRLLPLRSRFLAPNWIVVLSESRADVLAPMAHFNWYFPLVILLSLWVVLLLSVSQIRRSLVPLEKLREGTERVAQRDFDSRVTVRSGDEFEELATSFNAMASQLGRQFRTLSTMGEIGRAILAALETSRIVTTLLSRIQDVTPCDCVSVILRDPRAPSLARAFVKSGGSEGATVEEEVPLLADEVQTLHENPEGFFVSGAGNPRYLAPLLGRGVTSALVLPVFLKESVSAIIALGYRTPCPHGQESTLYARQLADQVGVALSNARLIEELNQLNWGTLIALARTIDAKSPWTAGHSERVTDMALKIGWVLGLSQREIDVLHRGGLLHDICKIGISPDILDKVGELSQEEKLIMRQHVRIGARILEPVAAYAIVIPIVLHHHEWFDGSGYPDGLSGDAIALGARIFAVVDVFDALTSDRPYRRGLAREQAFEVIKRGAGHQFDPKVVEAFLALMDQQPRTLTDRAEDNRASVAVPLES